MRLQQIAGYFAAFVFAALFPAILVTIPFAPGVSFGQFAGLLWIGFCVALGHAIVLGLPLFLLLREAGWVNAWSSVGGGFVVGALGHFLISSGQFNPGFSYSVDGIARVINGVPTAAGWLSYFEIALVFGLLGACAGLVFWGVLKCTGTVPGDHGLPAGDNERGKVGARGAFAIAAILAMGAVLVLPAVAKDRTCHNKFRDTRMIGPALVRIDLSIGQDDWPRLIQLLGEFKAGHQLSLRNSGRDEFGARRVLALSLCNELGANIEAGHERWAAGVAISVYQLRDGANSATLANELVAELDRLWPNAVQFRDARGQLRSQP